MESIGEVIESSTTEFTTQCRELYSSPALGSLVVSGSTDLVYGVVSHVTTKSLDPGRRPRVMGKKMIQKMIYIQKTLKLAGCYVRNLLQYQLDMKIMAIFISICLPIPQKYMPWCQNQIVIKLINS